MSSYFMNLSTFVTAFFPKINVFSVSSAEDFYLFLSPRKQSTNFTLASLIVSSVSIQVDVTFAFLIRNINPITNTILRETFVLILVPVFFLGVLH